MVGEILFFYYYYQNGGELPKLNLVNFNYLEYFIEIHLTMQYS